MNLVTHVTEKLGTMSWPYVIKLDSTNKKVYWLLVWRHGNPYLYSSGYDGKDYKFVTSQLSPFEQLLGASENFLYLMQYNRYYLNEMNISNGDVSRSILVGRKSNQDLIVVSSSLQPMGKSLMTIIHSIRRCVDITNLFCRQIQTP